MKRKTLNARSTSVICLVLWMFLVPSKGEVPYVPDEGLNDLKKAVAFFDQGLYRKSLQVALDIFRRYGDVQGVWFPKWVYRVVKELPDPKDHAEVLRWTIEKRGGGFLYTMALKGGAVSTLIMDSYFRLGEYDEAQKWASWILSRNPDADRARGVQKLSEYHLKRGYHPPQPPPRNTWLPLPLRFREEDYFILVPLDEACKVLGFGCSITPNPKMVGGKGIRIMKPDAPNISWRFFLGEPLVQKLENGRGQTQTLAYAPFEEEGKVWVPFYWLAKQAGIRGWEVRKGKIYVAPK